jgi:hypothetical protein
VKGIVESSVRARLAGLGIPLFAEEPLGDGVLAPGEYEQLLVGMVISGDARLFAAIPCLLAAHDGEEAGRAVAAAQRALDARDGARLLRLYRIARGLILSRAPDLMLLTGRDRTLPSLAEEPLDLPDPSLLYGELTLAVATDVANERGEPDLAGEAASIFDTWIRIVRSEGAEFEPA